MTCLSIRSYCQRVGGKANLESCRACLCPLPWLLGWEKHYFHPLSLTTSIKQLYKSVTMYLMVQVVCTSEWVWKQPGFSDLSSKSLPQGKLVDNIQLVSLKAAGKQCNPISPNSLTQLTHSLVIKIWSLGTEHCYKIMVSCCYFNAQAKPRCLFWKQETDIDFVQCSTPRSLFLLSQLTDVHYSLYHVAVGAVQC